MPLATDLASAKAVIARVEHIGEEGMTIAESVFTNPEAVNVMRDLGVLAGMNLPAGTIAGFGATLRAVLGLFQPPTPAAAV